MDRKTCVIAGAGPAGLTAARELLEKTDVLPIVYEMTESIGGISRTVNYGGNRIDIGGHRFFSKSDRVMAWWQEILPLQGAPAKDDILLGRKIPLSTLPGAPDPEKTDRAMLIRSRLSRILYLRKFFDYPISLNATTIRNLGFTRIGRIGLSYARARIFPIRGEKCLEDFFINRFGRELYRTFFEDYTEKVWGVPCRRIDPAWGAQRVKGLSVSKALLHAARNAFSRDRSLAQKETETSLIGQFLYPKFGPGQLWEEVADSIRKKGGEIHLRRKISGIRHRDGAVVAVGVEDPSSGTLEWRACDYLVSSMAVRDLVRAFDPPVPEDIRRVADGLIYRDFITVGLLLRKLKVRNQTRIRTIDGFIPDNWIYVQERDVRLGRIQVFNNWSPYMVRDPATAWLGLEYFCDEGDGLWSAPDGNLLQMAAEELERIGMADASDVIDGVVIRMPKTYPAYFGSYPEFPRIAGYTDSFRNLFLVGRNGMHRYNNMDHSMLTAMEAVENIRNNVTTKDNIWTVNAEEEYHEEKSS